MTTPNETVTDLRRMTMDEWQGWAGAIGFSTTGKMGGALTPLTCEVAMDVEENDYAARQWATLVGGAEYVSIGLAENACDGGEPAEWQCDNRTQTEAAVRQIHAALVALAAAGPITPDVLENVFGMERVI